MGRGEGRGGDGTWAVGPLRSILWLLKTTFDHPLPPLMAKPASSPLNFSSFIASEPTKYLGAGKVYYPFSAGRAQRCYSAAAAQWGGACGACGGCGACV